MNIEQALPQLSLSDFVSFELPKRDKINTWPLTRLVELFKQTLLSHTSLNKVWRYEAMRLVRLPELLRKRSLNDLSEAKEQQIKSILQSAAVAARQLISLATSPRNVHTLLQELRLECLKEPNLSKKTLECLVSHDDETLIQEQDQYPGLRDTFSAIAYIKKQFPKFEESITQIKDVLDLYENNLEQAANSLNAHPDIISAWQEDLKNKRLALYVYVAWLKNHEDMDEQLAIYARKSINWVANQLTNLHILQAAATLSKRDLAASLLCEITELLASHAPDVYTPVEVEPNSPLYLGALFNHLLSLSNTLKTTKPKIALTATDFEKRKLHTNVRNLLRFCRQLLQ